MKLYVVGFGPGNLKGMTVAAREAIEKSEIIVGYDAYVALIRKLFPGKEYFSTPMRKERERVAAALELLKAGKTVSLISSGDSAVYSLAGLTLEIAGESADIEIIPGVTSALSGGALLGAPLGHDFAAISLSDLLTPWEKIEKRLICAAKGDFVIVLYNPSSKKRADYLARACDVVLRYRDEKTICGTARNIGREGEEAHVLTLGELRDTNVDMFTTVFIGSSETKITGGKMVTPRGYKNV